MDRCSFNACGATLPGPGFGPACRVQAQPLRQRSWNLHALSRGVACLLLACSFTALPGDAAPQPTSTLFFPTVNAYALDKQKITLPAGLEGETNLLLLSFARDQENQLETWTAVAQALQHTRVNFRAYRLPVAETENVLFRWWENASLRSNETDPELWHWVVPIYTNLSQFRAQLGIADEKSVVALLVDKAGHVLWRSTGVSTEQSRQALMNAAGGRAAGARLRDTEPRMPASPVAESNAQAVSLRSSTRASMVPR